MSKVYEIVTQKVLEAMNKGEVPWQKPWKSRGIRPFNAVSGREYNGGNFFLLSMFGFETPGFLTFNQIKAAGAKIKEGQEKKHFPVFFWAWLENKDKTTGKITKVPMLRFFLVWNVEQVEGYKVPERFMPATNLVEHDSIVAAEAIVSGFRNSPKVEIKITDKACYYPSSDTVSVPKLGQYTKPEEYYSTLFHELVHSTGHASRLNRKELMDANYFGSHDYSQEELTAELGAAFLCAEAGIDNTVDNSAAYIASWMKRLSNDPKMFWTAAGKAQKAVDLILNRKAKDAEEV